MQTINDLINKIISTTWLKVYAYYMNIAKNFDLEKRASSKHMIVKHCELINETTKLIIDVYSNYTIDCKLINLTTFDIDVYHLVKLRNDYFKLNQIVSELHKDCYVKQITNVATKMINQTKMIIEKYTDTKTYNLLNLEKLINWISFDCWYNYQNQYQFGANIIDFLAEFVQKVTLRHIIINGNKRVVTILFAMLYFYITKTYFIFNDKWINLLCDVSNSHRADLTSLKTYLQKYIEPNLYLDVYDTPEFIANESLIEVCKKLALM